MYKVSYIGRKNFVKFDDKHYLLYLNEEQAEVKNEETGDAVQGYAYTGSQPDGGTLVEAKDVTDDNPPRQVRGGTYWHRVRHRQPDSHPRERQRHRPARAGT